MLQFSTNMTVERRQSSSASNHAGEQVWGNWKKLQVLLVLAWPATENLATAVFIKFDTNTFVALFSLFVSLLAWEALCCHSALRPSWATWQQQGVLQSVPGASPPPRSRHLLGFGSLCLLLLCSFGILFVFS